MVFQSNSDNKVCRSIEPMLSDYQENALSARQVWEVEKHLTSCVDCSRLSQQMQATVQVLRSADRYDTGDDFMAKLHARLDELEPARSQTTGDHSGRVPHFLKQGDQIRRRSLREAAQDWLGGLRMGMRTWHLPALTAGCAAVALVLLVHGNMPVAPVQSAVMPSVERQGAGDAMSRQVALAASNPFDDPVAAKAEVDGAGGENHPDYSAPSNF